MALVASYQTAEIGAIDNEESILEKEKEEEEEEGEEKRNWYRPTEK